MSSESYKECLEAYSRLLTDNSFSCLSDFTIRCKWARSSEAPPPILCHSAILSCRCVFFRSICCGNFEDSKKKEYISDFSYEAMRTFVEFLYSASSREIHERELAFECIAVGDFFCVESFTKYISVSARETLFSDSCVFSTLRVVSDYNAENLKTDALKYISNCFIEVVRASSTDDIECLSVPLVRELLTRDDINASEETILTFTRKYFSHLWSEISDCIRFPLLFENGEDAAMNDASRYGSIQMPQWIFDPTKCSESIDIAGIGSKAAERNFHYDGYHRSVIGCLDLSSSLSYIEFQINCTEGRDMFVGLCKPSINEESDSVWHDGTSWLLNVQTMETSHWTRQNATCSLAISNNDCIGFLCDFRGTEGSARMYINGDDCCEIFSKIPKMYPILPCAVMRFNGQRVSVSSPPKCANAVLQQLDLG